MLVKLDVLLGRTSEIRFGSECDTFEVKTKLRLWLHDDCILTVNITAQITCIDLLLIFIYIMIDLF